MGKRIMVAVIFVPLIILMLFFAPSWVLPVVLSGLSMIALHEVLWSTGFVKNPKDVYKRQAQTGVPAISPAGAGPDSWSRTASVRGWSPRHRCR